MRFPALVLSCALSLPAVAQYPASFDGSFESKKPGGALPDGWVDWGGKYRLAVDDSIYYEGHGALRITPFEKRGMNDYGCTVIRIPVTFAGKTISLKGYLKLDAVTDGYAGLFMRVDDKSGAVYKMDNMQKRRLQGTTGWQQYNITLSLPSGGGTVYAGAINHSNGNVWADNLEVLIDGKPLKEAPPLHVYKADSDHAFDKGSGISISSLTPLQATHLEVLGKVWGFLKYYHPAIMAGEYNWDYELFRILPAVLSSTSETARNEVLLRWTNQLTAPQEFRRMHTGKMVIKFTPDLDWISDEKTLGTALSAALKTVAAMNRDDASYYLGLEPAGNPAFKNEQAYNTMAYPDAGFRLLALYRYWNIIQYWFPYKHLITEGWNNKLAEYIPAMINAADTAAYQTALLRLIAGIHDSHAGIYGANVVIRNTDRFRTLPLRARFVENKAVLVKVGDEKYGLQVGDVITAVNKEPVTAMVQRLLPLASASNYATQLNRIERILFQTQDSTLQLEYEREGKISSVTLATTTYKQAIIAGDRPSVSWKMIGEDVGYVYPGYFKNTQMDSVGEAFKNTKGMVIDMRSYPADNLLASLVKYVLPSPVPFAKFTVGSVQQPGLFGVTGEMKAGAKNKDYYRGKIVILVDATTQSNAEFVTMALRLAPRAVVLGSTTAGADGNVSYFALPGGVQTLITGIGVYYPDGRETQRVGIVPDIVMEPTVKGIRENRDELLDKALAIIRE
ncbi:S41 family peptidase [Chitinophaga sp. ARDCPP14]|uniref:S41 family peptidase n=1 Tax=Chitinophaga sp. ARDCPP14 TaxID=3391139 RepID=UPI003F51E242